MKNNKLLIIGLVFVMMLGVTGTARSGAGDPMLIVKPNSTPPGWGSTKRFKSMNTYSVWFVNADDKGSEQWYDDTIKDLYVRDKSDYEEWQETHNGPIPYYLSEHNIPSGGVVMMSGIHPESRWTGRWQDGKFQWFYTPGFNLIIECTYATSNTWKKEIWVPVYSTVYLYKFVAK